MDGVISRVIWKQAVQVGKRPVTRLSSTPPHHLLDAVLPHAPGHPPHAKPSPATPADYVSTGINHTSWKIMWLASQLSCPKIQNLTKLGHILCSSPSHPSISKLEPAPTSGGILLLWCTTHCLQTVSNTHHALATTGHCPTKNHSSTEPHTPEHPPYGQPFPTSPEDYIGTGTNLTSWKIADYIGIGANHNSWKNRHRHRHKPHWLGGKLNKHRCKDICNNQNSNVAPPECSDPTKAKPEDSNAAGTQENELKIYSMKR